MIKKFLFILILVSGIVYSEEYFRDLKYFEYPYTDPPISISERNYIIKHKNENKLVFYFRLKGLYNGITHSYNRDEILKYMTLENLENYYSKFNPKDKSYYGQFLYGKWIITNNNDNNVELYIVTVDENGNIHKNKYNKSPNLGQVYHMNWYINDIDKNNAQGYYSVPDYGEMMTIMTPNKIIFKNPDFFAPEENRLYEELISLFYNELPESFFKQRKENRAYEIRRMMSKYNLNLKDIENVY
jgi:hypothetical protein